MALNMYLIHSSQPAQLYLYVNYMLLFHSVVSVKTFFYCAVIKISTMGPTLTKVHKHVHLFFGNKLLP